MTEIEPEDAREILYGAAEFLDAVRAYLEGEPLC